MQLDVRVPSDNGDPLLSIWTLWWNAQQVPFSPAWWNGPIFYPAPDTLAFSDHRVGFGLIATPLIWSGLSPLLAYNITFLASYVLSGIAMYALAYSLTRRSDAAFLGGLAFAFHPFRADHLSHLELLSSYWLPVALLALHQWLTTTRRRVADRGHGGSRDAGPDVWLLLRFRQRPDWPLDRVVRAGAAAGDELCGARDRARGAGADCVAGAVALPRLARGTGSVAFDRRDRAAQCRYRRLPDRARASPTLELDAAVAIARRGAVPWTVPAVGRDRSRMVGVA